MGRADTLSWCAHRASSLHLGPRTEGDDDFVLLSGQFFPRMRFCDKIPARCQALLAVSVRAGRGPGC